MRYLFYSFSEFTVTTNNRSTIVEMMHNAVNWFEIPVADFDRAKNFYSAIYDYEMPEMMMGPNRMGFLLYDMQKGGIGGAIQKGDDYQPSASGGVRIYLNGGADLNVVLNRVEKAGGKIMLAKTQITPDLGYFATFEDTEGNHISLHSMA
jgi:predicted enzyme related to lactoylglutathione lyase